MQNVILWNLTTMNWKWLAFMWCRSCTSAFLICLMLMFPGKVKLNYWSVDVCCQVYIVCISFSLLLPFSSLTCMTVISSQPIRGSQRSCNGDWISGEAYESNYWADWMRGCSISGFNCGGCQVAVLPGLRSQPQLRRMEIYKL